MIGYRVSRAQLADQIEAHKPGWLTRAAARTEAARAAGKFSEASSIWSEVKPVYMRLQGGAKCVYCERKLESEDLGTIEQDVEHFRPKGSVRAWKPPAALKAAGVAVSTPPKPAPGYHLLAYDIFNYSAACKPCNSVLKSDCFPIAGAYQFAGEAPETLLPEKPLLVYPLGDFDDDPQDLIGFHGISPMPVAPNGAAQQRALVTIDFFKLDDFDVRKNLARERAMVIVALYPQLETLRQGASGSPSRPSPSKIQRARKLVDGFTSAAAAHASCARSFEALHGRDPAAAETVFEKAGDFIEASS